MLQHQEYHSGRPGADIDFAAFSPLVALLTNAPLFIGLPDQLRQSRTIADDDRSAAALEQAGVF